MNHLFNLLKKGKTQFHLVEECINYFKSQGFTLLSYNDSWNITSGGKYIVSPFSSMLVAFVVGDNPKHLRIAAAHTDFPMLKLKPNNELIKKGYIQANIETYGGLIKETWFDRPLGLAGKVVTRGQDPFTPCIHLFDSEKPIFIIPNLAPHLSRGNKSQEMDVQKEMMPILTTLDGKDAKSSDRLVSYIANSLSVSANDILDYDLYLYIHGYPTVVGLSDEFILSPRIDNISSVAAISKAIASSTSYDAVTVAAFFDNEEVGSRSKQGADSYILKGILDKLSDTISIPQSGFCMSVDVAHGTHPNYSEKSDITNDVILGNGIALKSSASQRYVTDCEAGAVFTALCQKADIRYQRTVNRTGLVGGQTLGPIMSAYVPLKAVDIGIPMLAMHSACETVHKKDYEELEKLLIAYFSH